MLLALATLLTELSLVRVFDALFFPAIAYFIISSALFGLGLSGIYAALKPVSDREAVLPALSRWTALFALATAALLPIMNLLPFDFNALFQEPQIQVPLFAAMYLVLLLPFFLAGLAFTNTYAVFAEKIRTLYFWDLMGAAIGSALIIPFISQIGPGGLLFCAAGLGFVSSALFSRSKTWAIAAAAAAIVLVALPLFRYPDYFDFVEHQGKRGVKWARENDLIEVTVWDPISKIDAIDFTGSRSAIVLQYDGGSQTSTFFSFDGDFTRLRSNLSQELDKQFWQRGVLASHYLMRDSGQSVLIIGSAAGQEIKAALMYGAQRVDGIELVRAVVELGSNEYSDFIGDIFHHPNVNVRVGEGRSFLRASDDKYDIIQIFSNHTSSSIAAGGQAVATVYLQTVEAYKEYFEHLSSNGVLHINHHNYPRMITTAAAAWAELGRTDFQKHVLIFSYSKDDTLPTFLVKNQPWTADEVADMEAFFSATISGEDAAYELVVNPLRPEDSSLPAGYFAGVLDPVLIDTSDDRIRPATDNQPYFNFGYKSVSTALLELPEKIRGSNGSIPLDITPLFLLGTISVLYAGVFTLIPLMFSEVGKSRWPGKAYTLGYFSCLGAGFIIVEIMLIQIFMKFIGSPLHTFTVVIATVLLGAGLGSFLSGKLGITIRRRWFWPFGGIISYVILLMLILPVLSGILLAAPLETRILVTMALLLPVGFFLGMPFPLGVLAIRHHQKGAIAWAWGMNGLFTVIGSLVAIFTSLQLGFNATLLFGLALYAVACLMLLGMRSAD
jgi:spermidine synthase